MSQISRALTFGATAHVGQVRKYTGEPYFKHCVAVAELVKEMGGSENQYIAALLHDTVEDTDVTDTEIYELFGEVVANLVLELTDVYTHEAYPDENRAVRKSMEADRMALVSDEAKLIKWCDLMDNTSTIVRYDPKFAVTYLREKANLIEKMHLDKLNLV